MTGSAIRSGQALRLYISDGADLQPDGSAGLAGITTMEAASRGLAWVFLPCFNASFAVRASLGAGGASARSAASACAATIIACSFVILPVWLILHAPLHISAITNSGAIRESALASIDNAEGVPSS